MPTSHKWKKMQWQLVIIMDSSTTAYVVLKLQEKCLEKQEEQEQGQEQGQAQGQGQERSRRKSERCCVNFKTADIGTEEEMRKGLRRKGIKGYR